MKEFIHWYTNDKEIFNLQERYDSMALHNNKKIFSENYIIDDFLFITAIISLLATTLTKYLLCKHKKLRMLMASLVLHQVKEVGTVTQKEINAECKIDLYKFGFDNYRSSNGCNSALQKIKIVQRMHDLYSSKNHDIHFKCTILYTYETMHNYRKYPFVQNHRHAKT